MVLPKQVRDRPLVPKGCLRQEGTQCKVRSCEQLPIKLIHYHELTWAENFGTLQQDCNI